MVMGLRRFTFYMSHFYFSFLKLFSSMFILTCPIFFMVKNFIMVPFILVLLIEYVIVCVLFALFCAIIFKKAGRSITACIVIWVGLLVLALVTAPSRLNVGVATMSALNPQAALVFAFQDLYLYQTIRKYQYSSERTTTLGLIFYT